MCGIAGFIEPEGKTETSLRIVERMAQELWRRGPDDVGSWLDPEAGVALGHQRLSIVDLSPAGHQPMISESERYVIVYNGEVYNHLELRSALTRRGHRFKGHSDTEVVVASVEEWGLREAVGKFLGMFAFALWDRKLRHLYLVRDRLGIKPLYYGRIGGSVAFASELRAFHHHPEFENVINREALSSYFQLGYIPHPDTIYRGILKLKPGTILSLSSDAEAELGEPEPYWSAWEAARKGVAEGVGEEGELVEELDLLLRDAVERRMIADVPLGAFLSGGIDSSVVVAISQAQSSRPIQTFTIGFHEEAFNEAIQAKEVARYLGTDHTELYVTAGEAMDVIPQLPFIYDEPFADVSQIPTFLVSQLASRSVKVALSGDGGDELFGGYNRYLWGNRVWSGAQRMPTWIKNAAHHATMRFSPHLWQRLGNLLPFIFPSGLRTQDSLNKLQKLVDALQSETREELYRKVTSHWKQPASLVINGIEPQPVKTGVEQSPDGSFTGWMMLNDATAYLPDDILTKLDRASMAVSLEARVPLLDHRVFEFAWRVPMQQKVEGGKGKLLLKRLLSRYLPLNLIERPKMGFSIPIGKWLRGELREWAEALLDPDRLKSEGYLRHESIEGKWRQHVSGERDWQYHLWDVLMFQAWLEAQSTKEVRSPYYKF